MTDGLFIILCAVAVVGTSVIWIQARRIRQLQRKVDVHAEALRMLAQPIHVELPPEPPTKPDLRVIKGGMVAFSAAASGTMAFLHRHAGAVSTVAAGLVGGILAGALILTNRGIRTPSVLRPLPGPGITLPSSAAPSVSTSSAPPSTTVTEPITPPPSAAVVPAVVGRRPSPIPRPAVPSTQRTTAVPSPAESSVSFTPSSVRPSPCPVGLKLRLDPILRIEVCA